jgi:hypothetical protein
MANPIKIIGSCTAHVFGRKTPVPRNFREHLLIPTISRRFLMFAALIGALAIMEGAMLLSVHQESQTSDEVYSLFAGYCQLTVGNYSICPAYPPLTKAVGALPLLFYHPIVPPMTQEETSDFRSGRIFLYSNRADLLLFAARSAMTVFPLLLAVLIFLAAWEMFGAGAALIALALIAFEPNFLAHGPLITNDVALACCAFATVYALWRYVVKPDAWRLTICGIACGLTLASKHSGIMVFSILFLLAVVEWLIPPETLPNGAALRDRANDGADIKQPSVDLATTLHVQDVHATLAPSRSRVALRLLLALAAVAAISVVVLWGFYGFRYNPMMGAPAPSMAPLLDGLQNRRVAAAITLATQVHLLPEAFLDGLAFFFATASRPTYLLGVRYLHGVWFYFPTVMAIKSTLGFLLLLALVPFARSLRARAVRRDVLWMVVPAAVFLAASMTSDLNIGVRHILPVYPFVIVLAAAGAWSLAVKRRAWAVIVGSMVLFHAISSLRAFPNYLPYSNEIWGGPSKTYRVLTDSNVDWGQGLRAAKRYLATHSATPCWMAYFGSVDPAYYEIPCKLLPVHTSVIWQRQPDEIPPVIEGTVLLSATELSGQLWGPGEINPYEQFRDLTPVDCVAGSILVYKGSFQVPLASALSLLGKVVGLANHGEFEAALAEVHAAEALAPHSVDVQFVKGRVLRALGRTAEAHEAFENAMRFALTIHPEAQTFWIPVIEKEMRYQ